MRKVFIDFSCSWEGIRRIQKRFNVPQGITLNKRTCNPVDIPDDDWELLKETERRGYIRIIEV